MQRTIFIGTVVVEVVLLSTLFHVSGRPIKLNLQQQGVGALPTLSADQVNRLVGLLRDERLRETQPERVYEALAQLGAAKAVVAIPDIVTLLTFRRPVRRETEIKDQFGNVVGVAGGLFGPGERYPAIRALSLIGIPCMPALIKAIETHDSDSIESKNAKYTVSGIFRGNLTEGGAYLEGAASRSRTHLGFQRLKVAADHINALATIENSQKR